MVYLARGPECIRSVFISAAIIVVALEQATTAFVRPSLFSTQSSLSCSSYYYMPLHSVKEPLSRSSATRTLLITGRSSESKSPLTSSTALLMANKLWDRLEIEEDEEPLWYLLNCVAGNELELLQQCKAVCADMPDAIKFVVPLEKKTRSHGAKRMLTETKVKYLGYVFAKLRLCPEVYEAIQGLDLCRSWMGTVNHKGYKKLPPVPVALNYEEVENFGLEDLEEIEDEQESGETGVDSEGIIVDSGDDDDDEKYEDTMYKGVDKQALKKFKGLKVEDMVKVTKNDKFYNEDGIIRRLKDGKILVRFYTYGSMFEEWMDPGDVRKLSGEEILRGLGGPSQPITQRDFDEPSVSSNDGRYGRNNDRPGDMRQSLTGGMRGRGRDGLGPGGRQRNRRQDRIADRYGRSNNEDSRRDEQNWNWFKERQQQKQPKRGADFADNEWTVRPGSREQDRTDSDWAQGDVDSQWGRKSQRQTRRESRKVQQHQLDNRQTEAAIDGNDDWSAFVSSTSSSPAKEKGKAVNGDADDFFASLMTDLSKDLESSTSGTSRQQQQTQQHQQHQSASTSTEDDFFASLMTELSDEAIDNGGDELSGRRAPSSNDDFVEVSQDDDFFAALEAELGAVLEEQTRTDSKESRENDNALGPINTDLKVDDFFAEHEGDLKLSKQEDSSSSSKRSGTSKGSSSALNAEDLGKKTVPVLKEMLRERGLKVSGKKAELVERLLES